MIKPAHILCIILQGILLCKINILSQMEPRPNRSQSTIIIGKPPRLKPHRNQIGFKTASIGITAIASLANQQQRVMAFQTDYPPNLMVEALPAVRWDVETYSSSCFDLQPPYKSCHATVVDTGVQFRIAEFFLQCSYHAGRWLCPSVALLNQAERLKTLR